MPRFSDRLVAGICFAFRWNPAEGQRILASAYVLGVFQLTDLSPFSLRLIDWLHALGGENRYHDLAQDVRHEINNLGLTPLMAPFPWGRFPGMDWARRVVTTAKSFAVIASLPEQPLQELEESYSWVCGLTFAEDPHAVRIHLLLSHLVPTGMDYFDGRPERGDFLLEVYRSAPRGAVHFPTAHAALTGLEAGVVPEWFVEPMHDRFADDLERAWTAATFDPTPRNQAEPLTFEDRRAALAVYRGHLDVAQVSDLYRGQTDWASSPESTASHLHGVFVQSFRSLTR